MKVYLTSENYIRTKTNIDSNIESKYLQAAMDEAHLRLEEVIGTKLISHLSQKIKDGDEFDDIEKKLMSYIQPYIAYGVIADICVTSSFKITNAGVSQTSDEHITNAKYDEVIDMRDFYGHKAEDYQGRIQRHILNNYSHFSKWVSQEKCNDFQMNLESSANTHLWLGGMRGRVIKPYGSLRDKYESKRR